MSGVDLLVAFVCGVAVGILLAAWSHRPPAEAGEP